MCVTVRERKGESQRTSGIQRVFERENERKSVCDRVRERKGESVREKEKETE